MLGAPALAETDCLSVAGALGALYSETQSGPLEWSYRSEQDGEVCVFLDIEGNVLVQPEGERPFWSDQVVHLESLRVSGEALERLTDGGLPDVLRLEATGYYVGLHPSAEFYRYSSDVQARFLAVDAVLDMSWDKTTGVLDIGQFEMTLGWGQTVEFSVRVDGVDGSSRDALETSLPLASVGAAEVTFEGAGLFEFYVLDWIGWRMELMAEPPADWLADRVAARQADIDAAPSDVMPDASKMAAIAFLDDLPHPEGSFRVAVTAEPGLGMARFGRFAIAGPPETIADLWPALDGVVIDVEYLPEASE